MNRWVKNVIASKILRNVITVVSGAAAAQALTMIAAPFITRLYGPEAFGQLGTFTAVASVLVPVAALTYPVAIVLPASDKEARSIVVLSVGIAVVMASLVTLVLIIADDLISQLGGLDAIRPFLLLLPFMMFLGASLQISQQWYIRKKKFAFTARVAVIHSALLNAAKIVGGFFAPVAGTLVIIVVVGTWLHAVLLTRGSKATGRRVLSQLEELRLDGLTRLAASYRDFPLFRAPQAFLNPLSHGLPVLMLAGFFGPASAGFYTLTRSVLAMPSALLATAVGNVLYPQIAEAANRKEKVGPVIGKATIGLGLMGMLPFGLLMLFGPSIFSYVFGGEWREAGQYAQWVALWMFFGFINRPSNVAVPVLGLLPFFLMFEVCGVIVRALALIVGFWLFESAVATVALFCIAGAFLNILLISIVLIKAFASDAKIESGARTMSSADHVDGNYKDS